MSRASVDIEGVEANRLQYLLEQEEPLVVQKPGQLTPPRSGESPCYQIICNRIRSRINRAVINPVNNDERLEIEDIEIPVNLDWACKQSLKKVRLHFEKEIGILKRDKFQYRDSFINELRSLEKEKDDLKEAKNLFEQQFLAKCEEFVKFNGEVATQLTFCNSTLQHLQEVLANAGVTEENLRTALRKRDQQVADLTEQLNAIQGRCASLENSVLKKDAIISELGTALDRLTMRFSSSSPVRSPSTSIESPMRSRSGSSPPSLTPSRRSPGFRPQSENTFTDCNLM